MVYTTIRFAFRNPTIRLEEMVIERGSSNPRPWVGSQENSDVEPVLGRPSGSIKVKRMFQPTMWEARGCPWERSGVGQLVHVCSRYSLWKEGQSSLTSLWFSWSPFQHYIWTRPTWIANNIIHNSCLWQHHNHLFFAYVSTNHVRT